MGDDHRHHAQCGGGGGEEDGSHTAAARFEGGFLRALAVHLAQTLRIFEHDDGVAHDDTNEADYTQHRRDAEVQPEEPEPETRPEDADQTGRKGQEDDVQPPERVEQEDEEHQHRRQEAERDFGNHHPVDAGQAAVADFYIVGNIRF